jgi:hypothetical protein
VAVAETAQLAVKMTLDGSQFHSAATTMEKRIGGLGTAARKAGKVIGIGLAAGAAAGAVFLGDQLRKGIDALKADAVVAAQTAAVIKSTGSAAGITAGEVEKLAGELSTLNGIQDDLVQASENVFLRFTSIGKDIFPAVTQAAIDMAAATGGDASDAALKLGRALDNPVKSMGALTRSGIVFTDEEKKQITNLVKHNKLAQAQAIILRKVQQRFDGVAKAQADADPGRRQAVSVERLQKALASGLLPVVQKVQERVSTFLSKPETVATITRLGDAIAGLFTDQNLDTVAKGMETAANAVSGAIGLFNKLPPEIKALAIGAFAVNKVTGGAVGGAAEAVGKLIGAGLKQIFAANVTVIGTNVTGGGGVPVAPGGGGIGGVVRNVATLAGGVGVGLAVGDAANKTVQSQGGTDFQHWGSQVLAPKLQAIANNTAPLAGFTANVPSRLEAIRAAAAKTAGDTISEGNATQRAIAAAQQTQAAGAQRSINAFRAGERATLGVGAKVNTSNAKLGAIARKRTSFTTTVKVNTSMSVSDVTGAVKYRSRVSRGNVMGVS